MDNTAKIISVSSGNSGVGKTCTAVNLSVLLAQRDYKVCLFDADAKLENVNIMLNLLPDFTLQDVLAGEKSVNDITHKTNGFDVIPGVTGLTNFISLSKEQQVRLQNTMQQLSSEYDYLIIDNTAGISDSVRYYNKISNHSIIVITPDPVSLSAAFSLIRILQKRGSQKTYQIMVNNVSDEGYARRIFKRFFIPIEEHIGCQINYLGCVMSDDMIPASICIQNPVALEYPTSSSAFSYSQLARRLILIPEQITENKHFSNEQKTPDKQPSVFSSNTATFDHDKKHIVDHAATQPISTEQLKNKIISDINDEHIENQNLKEMVLDINSAYSKRFGHYAIDLPHVIHDALKMDHLSEQTLRNLLMTLHSIYQDQYVQTPMAENPELASNSNSDTSKLTQETVNLLIKLLQQESLSNMQTELQQNSIPAKQKKSQLSHDTNNASPKLNDLLETIRYASMVDS